jgi:hypothetical protein
MNKYNILFYVYMIHFRLLNKDTQVPTLQTTALNGLLLYRITRCNTMMI